MHSFILCRSIAATAIVAHPGARHGPGAGSTGFGEVVVVGVGVICLVG